MLGAAGIGVTDLEKSVDFYINVLGIGLSVILTYDVDAYLEKLLGFPPGTPHAGTPILLMEYKDKSLPKPQHQQGKYVFYVDSVEEVMARCKKYGSPVYLEIGGSTQFKEVAMVGDPDGFAVEFIPKSLHWSNQPQPEKPNI